MSDDSVDRRRFMKYGFIGIASIASALLPIKVTTGEGFIANNKVNIAVEESRAYARCGVGVNCSGGGGQCGLNPGTCGGGGGQCGALLNCGGS
jgi:hypothetical protein